MIRMDERLNNLLQEQAQKYGVSLSEKQRQQFDRYMDLLLHWNEKMNLTAIRDPEGVVIRHFADSLSLFSVVSLQAGMRVIDVGTGAGFPGIPLLIVCPQIELTLLDSLNKRLIFLQEVLTQLGLSARCIHARAEEGGRTPELREQFDLATARAVAALPVLCEYCLPLVKVGGVFIAMKGPDADAERTAAANALKKLGGQYADTRAFTLPDGSERRLVVMKKISQTPTVYPRNGGKIAKKPL